MKEKQHELMIEAKVNNRKTNKIDLNMIVDINE